MSEYLEAISEHVFDECVAIANRLAEEELLGAEIDERSMTFIWPDGMRKRAFLRAIADDIFDEVSDVDCVAHYIPGSSPTAGRWVTFDRMGGSAELLGRAGVAA